ncbi:hypothetical protein LguiB_031849 [Lonicera macranthoides]
MNAGFAQPLDKDHWPDFTRKGGELPLGLKRSWALMKKHNFWVIIEGFKSYKEQVATEPFSPKFDDAATTHVTVAHATFLGFVFEAADVRETSSSLRGSVKIMGNYALDLLIE